MMRIFDLLPILEAAQSRYGPGLEIVLALDADGVYHKSADEAVISSMERDGNDWEPLETGRPNAFVLYPEG